MKLLAINGSPRLTGNTATLLHRALDGARCAGFATERIDLYRLNYKGCTSCFYCKRKEMAHGTCAMRDDLTDVLEKLKAADAVVFGSPVYFMSVTSGLWALFERLFFSSMIYSAEIPTVFPKVLPAGIIYDMNITEQQAADFGLYSNLAMHQQTMATLFRRKVLLQYVYNTWQFSDYSKYESSVFNEQSKLRQRENVFPEDCRKAFEMGRALARSAAKLE